VSGPSVSIISLIRSREEIYLWESFRQLFYVNRPIIPLTTGGLFSNFTGCMYLCINWVTFFFFLVQLILLPLLNLIRAHLHNIFKSYYYKWNIVQNQVGDLGTIILLHTKNAYHYYVYRAIHQSIIIAVESHFVAKQNRTINTLLLCNYLNQRMMYRSKCLVF